MHFGDTVRSVSEEKDSRGLVDAPNTKRLLREFIEVHLMVRDLQQRLKAAKSDRQKVEKDLAQIFTEAEVQTVDIPGFRLYRYDLRLVPYHLPKRVGTCTTVKQTALAGNPCVEAS